MAGVEVRVHVGFVVLLVLVAASGRIEGSAAVRAIVAFSLVFVCFASVAVHEAAHVVTARRFGTHAASVSLLPLGGIVHATRTARTPSSRVPTALAGLAASALLAGGAALTLRQLGLPWAPRVTMGPSLASLLQATLWTNLVLLALHVPADLAGAGTSEDVLEDERVDRTPRDRPSPVR